jgi:hypothetical protein
MTVNGGPLVLAFVSDLYFTVRIENAVRQAGARLELIERAQEVEAGSTSHGPIPPQEPYGDSVGLTDAFLKMLIDRSPNLMIFDLGLKTIPWQAWISAAKRSTDTSHIPIITFGPHVNLDMQLAAQRAGADQVLAKSRFIQILPDLISRHASHAS